MFTQYAKPALRLLALTTALSPVFIAGAALADTAARAPLQIAQADPASPAKPAFPPSADATPAPKHTKAVHHAAAPVSADPVETRITDLHAKLKITADQEPQFQAFADVMRDNAKTISPLIKARMEDKEDRNAVDDLKSYQEITDAHADALKKLIPAFSSLYDVMTPDQKKIADATFAKYEGRHGDHGKS